MGACIHIMVKTVNAMVGCCIEFGASKLVSEKISNSAKKKNDYIHRRYRVRMDEKPRKEKIALPHLDIEEVKKSSSMVSSPPSSPSTLRKTSSVRYNCLCSPTTHAGSFRCRKHRNASTLTRNSMSVGSKLSDLAVAPKLSELAGKPARLYDLHAQ
ncbi:uncharacterized protein LOC132308695 [Cornus florida]|uniref:uncharacterized protein LOC132308695 n=1 Tax=Cornus florida TaxID=4283 RepID=UPI0028A20104|nr:uncharacterized protein LOC132308695 [Cornus florida]